MGFLSRIRRNDEPEEQICPKCRMPAPVEAETCPECGWDLREAYHPEATAPPA
jgi:predicted amidophosphoribosyltransferase